MAIFEYRAVNPEGRNISGHMAGDSLDQVASRLAQQGLQVLHLGVAETGRGETFRPSAQAAQSSTSAVDPPPLEARHRFVTDFVGPLVGGVPLTKLSFMFRQLGTLLNAGIETRQALETLSLQSGGKLGEILHEASQHAAVGRPISAGFQRYPEVFTPVMMGLLRAGEDGGFLSDQCIRIADYIQRDVELRNLVRRETFYPKLVFVLSIIIISGTNFIINALKPGASGISAPTLIWFVVLGFAVWLWFFGRVLLKRPEVKRPFDEIVISLPYIGPMMHGFSMAMFGRAFGALFDAGMPMGRSLQLAADSCGNEAVRAKIYPVVHRLDEGQGVYETFAQANIFSPVVMDMVRAGEMTGNLNDMLIKASEYYEEEGKTTARQGAMILGAVALLLVAVYVGYVVISFYMNYAQGQMSNLNE